MLTIAGVDRGLTVDAIRRMEVGQVVDYVEEYNRIHDEGNGKKPEREETVIRDASQGDWDDFLG